MELLREGYIVFEEYRITVQGKLFIVDVAGFKGKQSVAVECGRTRYNKIEKLRMVFSRVHRLYYTTTLSPKIETKRRMLKQSFTQAIHTVHGHGKIQVPKAIREDLDLKDGDKVAFYRDSEGKIFIIKIEPSVKGRGYTPTTRRP